MAYTSASNTLHRQSQAEHRSLDALADSESCEHVRLLDPFGSFHCASLVQDVRDERRYVSDRGGQGQVHQERDRPVTRKQLGAQQHESSRLHRMSHSHR